MYLRRGCAEVTAWRPDALASDLGGSASSWVVEDHGPDSPRNGIALSRTLHWGFGHGIISLEDNGRILVAGKLLPAQLHSLLNPNGYAHLPDNPLPKPHPQFLRYHRENRFRG